MADLKITELEAVVTPADADLVATVQDVATTPVTKKSTWTVIKAFLKTYFDTLYILKSIGTAAGDIIYFTASGTPARLAKGTDDQVLTLASGVPAWADAGGGGGGYAFGYFDRTPSTATDLDIAHGLGVTPSRIKITTYYAYSGKIAVCTGIYDGTNQSVVQASFDTGTVQPGPHSFDNYVIAIIYGSGFSPAVRASATFDSTNITLDWTYSAPVSGDNTLSIMWEAWS